MVTAETYIDGQLWTMEQLEAIEYQRDQHVLHELIRVGVELKDGNTVLTDDDVNYLEPADARRISVETRLRLGNDGVRKAFAAQLKRSDDFWHKIAEEWDPATGHVPSEIEMHVHGTTLQALMAAIANATEELMANAQPEHYAYYKEGAGNHGVEVMGMFGGPVAFTAGYDEVVGGGFESEEVEPGWKGTTGGAVHLESDGTDIHVCSRLQFKPTEDGFLFKTAILWPTNAPAALVQGHKLHYAIEYLEGFRLAAGE